MSADFGYYVIYSNTSRNQGGLKPNVMWTSRNNIIVAAAAELNKSGESLEDLAGVQWIEDGQGDMKPERELTDEEVTALSVKKLGDDGRLYEVFIADKAGAKAFLEHAYKLGLGVQAAGVLAKFRPE